MCYTKRERRMTTIKQITVEKPFRYLWLKCVEGVNLKEHCAHCLLGTYFAGIDARTKHASNLSLPPAPYYYLCGVSIPYCWAKNFHLAFREKTGHALRVKRHGIAIEIENAKEIKFSEADINPDDPHIKLTAYRTCRNWQFAHKICNLL